MLGNDQHPRIIDLEKEQEIVEIIKLLRLWPRSRVHLVLEVVRVYGKIPKGDPCPKHSL